MNSGALFVEILDRHDRVLHRAPVPALPARIGRGYHCAVVLDDPYVAPEHAELHLNENTQQLTLTDLGTRNGLRRLDESPRKVERSFPVLWGETIECGKTRLRVCSADMPLAPERPLDLRLVAPPALTALLTIGVLGLTGFETWFSMVNEVKPLTIVTAVAMMFMVLLAWSGFWALLNRIFQATPKFTQHLAWAALSTLAVTAYAWAVDFVSFSLNWSWLSNWHRLGFFIIAALVVIGHLTIMLGRPTRTTLTIVGGLSAAAMALMMVNTYQTHKRLAPSAFMTTVLPSSWRISKGATTEEFFSDVRADKAAVDALRALDGDEQNSD